MQQGSIFLLCSKASSLVVSSIACLVLCGWVFGIDRLKSVSLGHATMKPNTAFLLLLAAASLWFCNTASKAALKSQQARRSAALIQDSSPGSLRVSILVSFSSWLPALLAFVVLAGALSTLSEYWFGLDLGIDQMLIRDSASSGRMAPATALNLSLAGTALILLGIEKARGQPIAAFPLFQIFALLNCFLAFIAVLGYLFGVHSLYQVAAYSSMAIHTAICLALLGLGFLFARPSVGLMRIVSADSLGGVIARRLLPFSILAPIIVSWSKMFGEKAGWYGSEFGLAMRTTADVSIFAVVAWWLSWGIHRVDTERRAVHAETLLAQLHLEERIGERTSELSIANAELVSRAGELARSNSELEQFAYVASHDLKEPLRMVVAYSDLLTSRYRGKLGPDADEFLGFILDGSKRMQRLIQDLLEYARINTRGMLFEPVDMQHVLNQAAGNLALAIEVSKTVISHDAMPIVQGEKALLRQLLQNLVANAIKYNQSPSPLIHISSQPLETGSPLLLFSVKDNGIGIDPSHKEKIFIIFQRLHGREEYEGTGIGLSICKKIVEHHGGSIWVESDPGAGSTFFFTLPT